MKKRLIRSFGLILILSFVLLSASQVWAGAKYNWRFAHEELQGGLMDAVANEFKKRLAEKSNGQIDLAVYPSGTLGTEEDMVEMTQHGAIDFNFADAGHIGSLIPEAQVFLLHYLFPKEIDVMEEVMLNGKFKSALGPKYNEKGLELLETFTGGWSVWTMKEETRNPADLKSFKMRTMTSKLCVENWKAYDANPTPTPYSEVYTALQLNMVKGQSNPVYAIYDMKFFEVTDHLIFAYTKPYITSIITNQAFFNGLPNDIQTMVRETVKELIPFGFAWQADFNKSKLEKIKAAKPDINIVHLTQPEIDALKVKAAPVKDVYFKMAGSDGEKLLSILEQDIKNAQKKLGYK
jgi:tripartite ATP-independent transporter DctP family solute receptor